MSEHDDPLSALLEAERDAPGMPADVSARLASRLGIPMPGAGGASDPGNGSPPDAASSGGGASGGASGVATELSRWTLARATQLGLVFVLGAGTGVVADRMLSHPEPAPPTATIIAAASHVTVPAPAAPVASEPIATALAPVEEPAPTVPTSRGDGEAHATSDAERLWLERAEAAYGSGDARAALSALDAHARRFPHGGLSEERDALRIRALYLVGERDEADRRAERFASAYPASVFARQITRAREGAEQTHTPVTVP